MDSEKARRDYEKLRDVSDYLELINQLDSAASQVPNNDEIDKAIATVARGLHKKIKYVVNVSKCFTKKESLWQQIKTFWQRKKEEKGKVAQEELTEAQLRLDSVKCLSDVEKEDCMPF